MVWLPMQSAAAAVLSVCVQEKSSNRYVDKSAPAIDSHHHDGCQKQTADDTSHHVLANLPCDDTACDAYSNTPIPPSYAVPVLPARALAIPPLSSGFVSFVPEQPQRPPLITSL
ncbi:MAG: hypothetical protein HRU78_14095 [Gammaproteobacteria bacterium]|nr:MAG: hypothetical protein HRU78_14095 [Gammaproteobacteria bacterium]